MGKKKFKSQISIAETAEKLGKKALGMGLISDFSIHFSPDTWEFYLDEGSQLRVLTAKEAYLHLKKIVPR